MMDHKRFIELFEGFATTKIGVVGDIMLDTYWWGGVDRISPEAPVPIVSPTIIYYVRNVSLVVVTWRVRWQKVARHRVVA